MTIQEWVCSTNYNLFPPTPYDLNLLQYSRFLMTREYNEPYQDFQMNREYN